MFNTLLERNLIIGTNQELDSSLNFEKPSFYDLYIIIMNFFQQIF